MQQEVLLPAAAALDHDNALCMRYSAVAARQAALSGWPSGPSEYGKLFAWPDAFAKQLLQGPDAAERVAILRTHAKDGIAHVDSFSGLGTAPTTLKQTLRGLCTAASTRASSVMA